MSTRRDRAAEAVALTLWRGLTEYNRDEAYRIADMVLAEVDRIPDVSELTCVLPQHGHVEGHYHVGNKTFWLPKTDDGAVRSPATPGAVTNPAAQAEGTGWRPAPSSPLPRPFLLFRIRDVSGTSGTGVVAWGCEFPDGAAALRWNGPHPSTAAWPSVEDIVAVHGHQGATVIHWLNGGA